MSGHYDDKAKKRRGVTSAGQQISPGVPIRNEPPGTGVTGSQQISSGRIVPNPPRPVVYDDRTAEGRANTSRVLGPRPPRPIVTESQVRAPAVVGNARENQIVKARLDTPGIKQGNDELARLRLARQNARTNEEAIELTRQITETVGRIREQQGLGPSDPIPTTSLPQRVTAPPNLAPPDPAAFEAKEAAAESNALGKQNYQRALGQLTPEQAQAELDRRAGKPSLSLGDKAGIVADIALTPELSRGYIERARNAGPGIIESFTDPNATISDKVNAPGRRLVNIITSPIDTIRTDLANVSGVTADTARSFQRNTDLPSGVRALGRLVGEGAEAVERFAEDGGTADRFLTDTDSRLTTYADEGTTNGALSSEQSARYAELKGRGDKLNLQENIELDRLRRLAGDSTSSAAQGPAETDLAAIRAKASNGDGSLDLSKLTQAERLRLQEGQAQEVTQNRPVGSDRSNIAEERSYNFAASTPEQAQADLRRTGSSFEVNGEGAPVTVPSRRIRFNGQDFSPATISRIVELQRENRARRGGGDAIRNSNVIRDINRNFNRRREEIIATSSPNSAAAQRLLNDVEQQRGNQINDVLQTNAFERGTDVRAQTEDNKLYADAIASEASARTTADKERRKELVDQFDNAFRDVTSFYNPKTEKFEENPGIARRIRQELGIDRLLSDGIAADQYAEVLEAAAQAATFAHNYEQEFPGQRYPGLNALLSEGPTQYRDIQISDLFTPGSSIGFRDVFAELFDQFIPGYDAQATVFPADGRIGRRQRLNQGTRRTDEERSAYEQRQ